MITILDGSCYHNGMSDERFRKLLREFQTEPVTVTTVGRIYNEYLRQGEDPAPFMIPFMRDLLQISRGR